MRYLCRCTTGYDAAYGKDCAGTCNGTAVLDDCKVCSGGASGNEFNKNKDCAGQCFGSHKPTDPACNCKTFLDACYVCGGDNSSCAGCDGIPYSGVTRDYCGVCGGNSTRCCNSIDSTVYIRLQAYEAIPSSVRVVTGQMVVFVSVDAQLGTDSLLISPSGSSSGAKVLSIVAGNEQSIVFGRLGTYTFYSQHHSIIRGTIDVYAYNHNATTPHGLCERTIVSLPEITNSTLLLPNPAAVTAAATSLSSFFIYWLKALWHLIL